MTLVILSICATIVARPFFIPSSAVRLSKYSARPRITFIGVPISCAMPDANVPSSANRSARRSRISKHLRSVISKIDASTPIPVAV